MAKLTLYSIEMNGSTELHPTIEGLTQTIAALFEGQEFEDIKDDEYTIGVRQMEEEEYAKLPEFDGF